MTFDFNVYTVQVWFFRFRVVSQKKTSNKVPKFDRIECTCYETTTLVNTITPYYIENILLLLYLIEGGIERSKIFRYEKGPPAINVFTLNIIFWVSVQLCYDTTSSLFPNANALNKSNKWRLCNPWKIFYSGRFRRLKNDHIFYLSVLDMRIIYVSP